jgi:putative tryptophan/tyrosine transport system substrate-binding protein
MERREFITLLGTAGALWPLAARSQEPSSIQKIGFLTDESLNSGSDDALNVLANALSKQGYTEGRNIAFESRYANNHDDILPGLAAELVRERVNVIFSVGTAATRAAKNATDLIPIVFSRIADPVAMGLVESLAQPGANLTGVSVITRDLAGKRLQMLTQFVPGIKRIGVLWDPTFPPAPLELQEVERAAPSLNIDLVLTGMQRAEQLDASMNDLMGQRIQALYIVTAILFTELRERIAAIAIENRIPTMLYRKELVEAGGLVSYGPNFSDMYRRAAGDVAKILRGAKPSDLPVEEPDILELIVNLRTAKAIGFMPPQSLLIAADEVIE